MKPKEIRKLSSIIVVSALLLGTGLLVPALASVNTPLAATTTNYTTNVNISGTFVVVSDKVLATVVSGGLNITVSIVTVARNESTTPGQITGVITYESVKQVNMTTDNGTSFGVGIIRGTIAGIGPGECTYRINTTLTAQGTPNASSQSQHFINQCTGGLSGISEISTSIGKGVFTAIVTVDPSTPATTSQAISPYSYVIIAAALLLLLVSAVLFVGSRKASSTEQAPQTALVQSGPSVVRGQRKYPAPSRLRACEPTESIRPIRWSAWAR
jgi:hypothetical protein